MSSRAFLASPADKPACANPFLSAAIRPCLLGDLSSLATTTPSHSGRASRSASETLAGSASSLCKVQASTGVHRRAEAPSKVEHPVSADSGLKIPAKSGLGGLDSLSHPLGQGIGRDTNRASDSDAGQVPSLQQLVDRTPAKPELLGNFCESQQ